jgi:hypothetical protein
MSNNVMNALIFQVVRGAFGVVTAAYDVLILLVIFSHKIESKHLDGACNDFWWRPNHKITIEFYTNLVTVVLIMRGIIGLYTVRDQLVLFGGI